MATGSLRDRLLFVAVLWSAVTLVAAGLLLSQLYRDAAERAFDARLHVHLKAIVAAVSAAPEDAEVTLGSFGEPRFDLPLSGWYWQVKPIEGRRGETLASSSLWDQALPTLVERGAGETRGMTREAYARGPADQRLRMVERRIDFGSGMVYAVTVAGDADEIDADVTAFVRTLWLVLGTLGLGITLSTLLQVRWGLRPLGRIRSALAAIRSGSAPRLEGDFPKEIAPLAKEVNDLIAANQDVLERARTHVGNLAHALKTPLSVITNEARAHEGPFAEKVGQQASIMRAQIQHHLDRARAAARIAVTVETTELAPVVMGLERAMERIYRDKGVKVRTRIKEGLRFRGERQDLEEILGNLVDNACKWTSTEVVIDAEADRGADGDGPRLRLIVDDDGPGMPADRRIAAIRRGQRLDESKPGTGLGLSIVSDLVGLYGGRFTLGTSPQGGLRAEVLLPTVAPE
jgi:signal transduction histidine kinase